MNWSACSVFVFFLVAGAAPANTVPPRIVAESALAPEKGEARLPRFSPDSQTLAYVVDGTEAGIGRSEIRVITLADGKRRTLLGGPEARQAAAYSAYAQALSWRDANRLSARLSDGDVGSTTFELDRRKSGAMSQHYSEYDDQGSVATADPALSAIVPDWKPEALANAAVGGLLVEGRGVLLQKHYAGEDSHVWWLDTQAGKSRVVVPERPGQRSELRGGFALNGNLLFALREGASVRVFMLAADGQLTTVPGAGVAVIPNAASLAQAITSSVGDLELRRCGPEACWALLRLQEGDWQLTQVLRLDRQGKVELIGGLDALEDFDVSADFRHLAVTLREGEHRRLALYRVLHY